MAYSPLAKNDSHNRMTYAIDAARLGMFEWVVETDKITWANDHIYKIFDRKKDEGLVNSAEFFKHYCHPKDKEGFREKLYAAARKGDEFNECCRIITGKGTTKWIQYISKIDRNDNNSGPVLHGIVQDITEHKFRESNLSFLNDISDKFSSLTDPVELFNYVSKKLSEYLDIHNCLFADIDQEQDTATISFTWNWEDDMPDLRGVYNLADFIDEQFKIEAKEGRAVVINNTITDPRVDTDNYTALGIYSYITIPDQRAGEWKYLFTVNCSKARQWRQDEVELVKDITQRLTLRIERARAEEKAKESEARFRALLKDAPALITVHEGPDHQFIFSNALHDNIVNDRKLLGKPLLKAMPELEDQGIIDIFNKVYKTGNVVRTDELVTRLNDKEEILGKKRYFTQILQPWFYEDKQIAGVMSFAYEITDQVELRKTLEDSERRLQLATKASEVGIYDYDIKEKILKWDETVRNFWGVDSPAEVNFDTLINGIHKDDVEKCISLINNAHTTGDTGKFEIEFRVVNLKTGETRWLHDIGKTFYKNGEPVKMLGTVRDVTERLEAQKKIRLSEEKLKGFISASNDVIFQVNDDWTKLIFFNGKGFVKDNPNTGSNWMESFIPQEDITHVRRVVRKAYRNKTLFDMEHQVIKADGSFGWATTRAAPIFGDNNNISGWFGTSRDITNQKKAQNDLIRSEQRFRLLADIAPLMIWITDAEGNVEFLNQQWYDYSGTNSELANANDVAKKSVHPEDAPKVMEVFGDAMKTGGPFSIEQRNLAANGEFRWFLNKGAPYKDPETGEIAKWYGVSVDIHDLKLAEQAIKESEEKYRLLYESLDIGFTIIEILFDEDGNAVDYVFKEINPAFKDQSVLKDPVGKRIRELVPDIEDFWIEKYGHVAKSGKPTRFVDYSENFDKYYDVYAYAIGVPSLNLVGVLFNNITEKRRSEQLIRDSEERLRLAAEATGFGTYDLNVEKDETIWSDELYRIFGYDFYKKIEKTDIDERIHPDDKEKFEVFVINSINSDKPSSNSLVFRIVNNKGETRWLKDQNRTYFHKENGREKLYRVIGTIQDITDTVMAEDALKDANRRKDEFLAMLAHELRNPLTPVRGALDLLKENFDESLQNKAKEIIDRQINSLVRLIDDLMDISRITRNKIKLIKREMNLLDAVEMSCEATESLIKSKNHTFNCDLPDKPVYVFADKDRLVQIINNLINNAAKYTPEGGHIKLSVTTTSYWAKLSIKDSGIGIKEDEKEKIFEMFQQSDFRNHVPNSGLGIGLSLVKNLTALHDGKIEVKSKGLNEGSDFIIKLPLIKPVNKELSDNVDKEDSIHVAGRYKVMVVDNNEDVTDIINASLKTKGFDVSGVYSGSQALEELDHFKPDAVILDIALPDIDGYHVGRKIKNQFPNALIIAHSGSVVSKEKLDNAGFDHHLTKPADVNHIAQLLVNRKV